MCIRNNNNKTYKKITNKKIFMIYSCIKKECDCLYCSNNRLTDKNIIGVFVIAEPVKCPAITKIMGGYQKN